MEHESAMNDLKSYHIWDVPTRCFHWINVLCVLLLAGFGLVILNAGALDISNPGKILLKTLHVSVGYVFALNIVVRLVWGFLGNRHARWRQMLPGGKGYVQHLRSYWASFAAGNPQSYLGHNPLGRIAITGLLLIMIVQASTGLLLAGTDIYFPPFGSWITHWIAAPGIDPATLVPYSSEMYDKAAYEDMRAMREPFALVHLYSFYLLAIGILFHISGVVITELREGGGLTSAMISGRKVLRGTPIDTVDSRPGDADRNEL
jgi:cytochrome b